MASVIGGILGFLIYCWIASTIHGDSKPNHKHMSNEQLDNEIDKYLK